MTIKKLRTLTLVGVLALASHVALAHGVKCGDLNIAHPYSTPTIGSGNTGAVYFMNIKNNGKDVDQQDVPAGLYVVQIRHGGKVWHGPIVVKR